MSKFEYICLRQLLTFYTTYYRMPMYIKCGTYIVPRTVLYRIYCKHFNRRLIDKDCHFLGSYKNTKIQFIRQLKSIHYEK